MRQSAPYRMLASQEQPMRMATHDEIVVVSGLPRSGTSMLMGMLAAGGMPLLIDAQRAADAHNPRGYFEYAPVKRLREDATWLPLARGRAVKVISFLLPHLPAGERYRILYLERDLPQVLASQAAMLGEPMPVGAEAAALQSAFQNAEARVRMWLEAQQPALLRLSHAAILADPLAAARALAEFLAIPLALAPMAASVDRGLHRQRGPVG